MFELLLLLLSLSASSPVLSPGSSPIAFVQFADLRHAQEAATALAGYECADITEEPLRIQPARAQMGTKRYDFFEAGDNTQEVAAAPPSRGNFNRGEGARGRSGGTGVSNSFASGSSEYVHGLAFPARNNSFLQAMSARALADDCRRGVESLPAPSLPSAPVATIVPSSLLGASTAMTQIYGLLGLNPSMNMNASMNGSNSSAAASNYGQQVFLAQLSAVTSAAVDAAQTINNRPASSSDFGFLRSLAGVGVGAWPQTVPSVIASAGDRNAEHAQSHQPQ